MYYYNHIKKVLNMDFEWWFYSIQIALYESFMAFISIAGYAVLGAFISEALKFSSWTKTVYKYVNANKIKSIIMAIFLGIVSPLCTFGTIPVVITLYKAGVKKEPLIAFLATSSLLNPQLFIMTAGGLGLRLALIRLLIVIAIGFTLGFSLLLIPEKWIIRKNFKPSEIDKQNLLTAKKNDFDKKVYLKNCKKQIMFIGKYIIIGSFLGGFIETFVPQDYVLTLFGDTTFSSIFIASLVGIPLYACGGGIIPTIQSLLNQGMSDGAAMAFMTVGQATRISPLMALASFLKVGFIIGYCVFLVFINTFLGLLI